MIYRFANFELDLPRGELRADGAALPIEPQVFALLALLLEHRDRLVSREEIFEHVWHGRIVSDSAITSRIKSARKALGDDGRSQRFIRTVHGKGLRFVADVRVGASAASAAPIGVTDDMPDDSAAERPLTGRPSIAVLPFRTDGGTDRHGAIADGLPHDLIVELARLRWLSVVARASSFRLRGADADPVEIGRLLNVRYCLSGAVELAGRRLVVIAELADTRSGDIVWAERYVGEVEDLHALREQLRGSILSQLEVHIPAHEARAARLSGTGNLDAWAAFHLGLQHLYRFNREDNVVAERLFTDAVRQDPDFARAHAGLSFANFQTAFLRQNDDPAGAARQARACAERGVELDPLDPFVNFTMGRSYWLDAELDRALSWLERSTSLSPNYAQGLYARGWTEVICGEGATARAHIDEARRLSPLDPLQYAMLSARGLTLVADGEPQEAVVWAERGAEAPGAHPLIALIAACTHMIAGNDAAARHWAEDVRRRDPRLTSAVFFQAFPMRGEGMRRAYADALALLGFDP